MLTWISQNFVFIAYANQKLWRKNFLGVSSIPLCKQRINALIHINLQSTSLLELKQLGSPSASTISTKPNVYLPRPLLRQFLNLVLCSPRQSILIVMTNELVTVCLMSKLFYLPNKHLSSYGGMFIKTKSKSIKPKDIWQRSDRSTSP